MSTTSSSSISEKCPASIAHNHLRGTCPITGNTHEYCAPQPGDVRSPCPALNTLANHGYLPRNGKSITLPAFARALQEGYALTTFFSWFLSIGSFLLLLQFTPLSLADIARHNRIEHDASLVHDNTPLEDEYAPSAINEALVKDLMKDGVDGKMSSEAVGKARFRRENQSPVLDGMHAEIARGEMAIALRVFATASAPDAGIPLPWLKTWIADETFPAGWTPSRKVGMMEVVKESRRIRSVMEALVKLEEDGETVEAEQEHSRLQEDSSDSDVGEGSSLFSTIREDTPETSEDETSEHEK